MKIRPVILCGGSGTRLWPKSRSKYPKQFIELFNNKSLFEKTLERVLKLNCSSLPLIVTNFEYEIYIKNILNKLNIEAKLILEPIQKNTTAAIYLSSKLSDPDEDLLILPSDHLIKDENYFSRIVKKTLESKSVDQWIVFGVMPSFASTGYGYLNVNGNVIKNDHEELLKVVKFEEKPNKEKAEKYLKNGFLWNSGIFMGNSEMIINSINNFAPEVALICNTILNKQKENNDVKKITFDKKLFDKIPSISIDYSVMEKEDNIFCMPFFSEWNDLGTWDSLIKEKNLSLGSNSKIVEFDSENNFILNAERTIATIGIKDLIIIDTPDATLISKKNSTEKVKDIVEVLNNSNNTQTIENIFEFRPWGKFENLINSKECKVKKITVHPFQRLSLQYHNFRSEHWVVVDGVANVYLNDKIFVLKKGESIDIPVKAKHFIENKTKNNLVIIEIQLGTYFGEDDIIRIDDPYNR